MLERGKNGRYMSKIFTKNRSKNKFTHILYGGDQVNFKLSFLEQGNSIDIKNIEMKIVVYNKENEVFICPTCREKIELDK